MCALHMERREQPVSSHLLPRGLRDGTRGRRLSSKHPHPLSQPVSVPHDDSVFILCAAVQTLIGSEVFCSLERTLDCVFVTIVPFFPVC